ncbi:MAG: hypothetical protein AB8G96_11060 [Phycisphaerales bacterium]
MTTTPTRRPAIMLATVAACGVALLGGCAGSSDPYNVSYSGITGNLTPELRGIHQRPIDVDKDMRMVNNFNTRMISDDLGRVFYTNRPSRLAPYEVPNFTGGTQ